MSKWIFLFLVLILGIDIVTDAGDPTDKHLIEIKSQLVELQSKMIERDVLINRYEIILNHIFQGQWSPDKAVKPEFVEDWYGTPIFRYTLVDGNPGDLIKDDLGDLIDEGIERIRSRHEVEIASDNCNMPYDCSCSVKIDKEIKP